MKTRFILCVVVVAALLRVDARAEWRNSLRPAGVEGGPVRIVKEGRAGGGIGCPDDATPQEKKAAADLQQWIREITGTTLPIEPGRKGAGTIVLRRDSSLGTDGYGISVEGGGVVLWGGTGRGVVNAVYALLEEDLGCRFYANDSILLPRTNTLVLQPVVRRYVPRLSIRDPFYACAFDPVWSLRNRTDAPSAAVPEEHGGRIDYGGMFVHTAAQMVPEGRYFKEHPEYFSRKGDGTRSTAQLCATEPEVANIAIAYVRQMLKENPHTEIVSVSKNDNPEVCHCERCVKLRDEEGSDMANQLVLVNRVAEVIGQEFPQVSIDTLAYLETIQVPKTARPRKNVVIRLCNDAVGSWTHPFTPAAECDVAKLVTAWSEVHNRIHIWDYNVNFSHYLAPMPNLEVMADNIRFWAAHHAEGVMLQGGYQGPAERDELKCWVTAKLLWDPSRDEKALTQDFIQGHYGKAAPALAEYEALLEGVKREHAKEMRSPAGGIRYTMDAPFFTKEFVTRATGIFARARELAAGQPELTRRVERAELPLLYMQCVRGPVLTGDGFGRVVGEFERIARREKVQFLQEGGPDFEGKLAGYKGAIPKPTR